MGLSKRLMTLANYIDFEDKVADIGTDHAYLPIYLIKEGICQQVIAGDLNKGPYQAAVDNVAVAGYSSKIEVRLGDGLSIVKPGEVDTAIIAGMGGATAVEILENAPEVLATLKKLIVQPMSDENVLRKWIDGHNWYISEEEIISENDKIYTIIVVQRGSTGELSQEEILFGPKLLEKKSPLLRIKVEKELEHKRRILDQIKKSSTSADKVIESIKFEIGIRERVLQWLSNVKQ